MSDKKKKTTQKRLPRDGDVDENHPMIATPKERKGNPDSASAEADSMPTMLIKRPEIDEDEDSLDLSYLSNEDGEMVIVGDTEEPLLSGAANKPDVDYLTQVAQDRRSLKGTKTRSIKVERQGEQTRIIDRSSHGDDLGSRKRRPKNPKSAQKGNVLTKKSGKTPSKKRAVEDMVPDEVQLAKDAVEAQVTGTVNLPRGAHAVKVIAELAEHAKKKRPVKAIEVPAEETSGEDEGK